MDFDRRDAVDTRGSTKSCLALEEKHRNPTRAYTGVGEDLTLIVVYVDDVLVMSRDNDRIEEAKQYLSKRFDMRDIGDAKYCLGLEIAQKSDSITDADGD